MLLFFFCSRVSHSLFCSKTWKKLIEIPVCEQAEMLAYLIPRSVCVCVCVCSSHANSFGTDFVSENACMHACMQSSLSPPAWWVLQGSLELQTLSVRRCHGLSFFTGVSDLLQMLQQQEVCQRLLALLLCRQLPLILACITIIINIIMALGCRICCTLLAPSSRNTSPTLQQLLQLVSDHSPPRRLFSTGRDRDTEREREREREREAFMRKLL